MNITLPCYSLQAAQWSRSSAVVESLSPARLNSTRETGVQFLVKPTKALEQGPNLQLLQVCSSL